MSGKCIYIGQSHAYARSNAIKYRSCARTIFGSIARAYWTYHVKVTQQLEGVYCVILAQSKYFLESACTCTIVGTHKPVPVTGATSSLSLDVEEGLKRLVCY